MATTVAALTTLRKRVSATLMAAIATLFSVALVHGILAVQPRFSFMGLFPLLCAMALGMFLGGWSAFLCVVLSDALLHVANRTDPISALIYLAGGAGIALLTHRDHLARQRTIEAMITLREANAMLSAANVALREAEEQTSTFLSVASHELRTPITSALIGIQMIERRLSLFDEAARTGMWEQINQLATTSSRNIKRLAQLEDALLDFSRISLGRLEVRPREMQLDALIGEIVARKRLLWPERPIVLHVRPSARELCVLADEPRVTQVVVNYMTNAHKFSPPGSPIVVRVARSRECGYVSVSDHGAGVAPEIRDRVWGIYSGERQAHAHSSAQGAGLGLGLYIARSIVELHGGTVGLVAKRRRGATFYFTLPLAGEEGASDGTAGHSHTGGGTHAQNGGEGLAGAEGRDDRHPASSVWGRTA